MFNVMKKHVTLVRHGESLYNQFRRAPLTELKLKPLFTYDPGFVDCDLSSNGRQQTEELSFSEQGNTLRNNIDLVISSPLSRAIDTALGLFYPNHALDNQRKPKILIAPLVTEWLDTLGDTGLSLAMLKEKYSAYSHIIDWEMMPNENWWYSSETPLSMLQYFYRKIAPEPRESVEQRASKLLHILSNYTEKEICIVGHSWFFMILTGEPKMHNCEVRRYELHSNDQMDNSLYLLRKT